MSVENFFNFSRDWLYLDGRPFRVDERPYLPPIYSAAAMRNLVLRCGRQVEKSTLLANLIVFLCVRKPRIRILVVFPREEQMQVFSNTRLSPLIDGSPVVRRYLSGISGLSKADNKVKQKRFNNGSEVYLRSAFSNPDAARGLSIDVLILDEFQDIAHGALPVLRETMSHSPRGQTIITGTPKTIDNHLEQAYRSTTANSWHVNCPTCPAPFPLVEDCLTPAGYRCPRCQNPIDVRQGLWVPTFPEATWGEGYCINQAMTPWMSHQKLLEKREEYDPIRFRNECWGNPVALGDYVITAEEMEACCTHRPMASTLAQVPAEHRRNLLAGIDWGAGGRSNTVVVIGHTEDSRGLKVISLKRFPGTEESSVLLHQVGEHLKQFQVTHVAADGGGSGFHLNRLLSANLQERNPVPIYGILYGVSEQQPCPDGKLWRWHVNRSGSLGDVFSRIKKKLTRFPRLEDFRPFLPEFTCETTEYDEHMRTIKYTHPESQPDDALHATNYLQLIALRAMYGRERMFS